MREVTIIKKVFKFDELDVEIQKTVLEKYRDAEVSHGGWWDPIYEGVKEDLKKMGIDKNVEIQFTGFFSQGDGASFTCDSFDIAKFIENQKVNGRFAIILDMVKSGDIACKIIRLTDNYVHENTIDSKVSYTGSEDWNEMVEEFEQFVSIVVRGFCKEIYNRLNKYYDELTSDENVKTWIEENIGEFEEDGEIYLDTNLEAVEEVKTVVDTKYEDWGTAMKIFKDEEGREPNCNDNKDLTVVAALQIGITAGRKIKT